MSETKGTEELLEVLRCLKTNNYEYNGISESNDSGMSVAEFTKKLRFTTATGEVHDSHIKVNVEFDDFFDYKNMGTKDHDDPDYLKYNADKSDAFVQNLFNGTYGGKKSRRRTKRAKRGKIINNSLKNLKKLKKTKLSKQ